MWEAIAILVVALGAAAPALLPFARIVARRLWPGPTVKGPADVYVQAIQVLVCLAVLTLVPIVASGAALGIALAIDWPLGRWLAATPLVTLVLAWTTALLLSRR